MNSLGLNTPVWAPDSVEGFVKGTVIDLKFDGLVVKSNSKTITAEFEQVYPAEDEKRDVDDNCALMYLNPANLLQNIKVRYQKDIIYTYVANILIAVNPYKDIQHLYSKDTIAQYKGNSIGSLPPHVYAIADQSFRNMRLDGANQSIIVSGESGAGKTETTKYLLQYLTECYGAHAGPIEQRIVESNPLLEAFGNAKTVRNNNSSRSGKFIEVHFSAAASGGRAQIVGGVVSHYLLEKSRVCCQGAEERNYHIFYRICAGMSPAQRAKYRLSAPDKYNYLRNGTTRYFCTKNQLSKLEKDQTTSEFLRSGCLNDIQLNDVEDFQKTCTAMRDMGLSDNERDEVFAVVAGVLHLGNIEFTESASNQGDCQVKASPESSAALQTTSQLLGLDREALADSLCNRYTQAADRGAQNAALRIALKPAEAGSARDAVAKAVYVRLFERIVAFVNRALPFSASVNYIGILDIAGFEYFERNSFEQFCINYCNEKMQQFFNQRILKNEQVLYEKEGLGLSKINYVDNQDCIDIIERKTIGIIDILDEESKLPKPNPANFTNTIFTKNPKNFRLQLPRKSKLKLHREVRDDEGFLVRHYAGAVCYHTDEFIDKNNDALHDSLRSLLEKSSLAMMQSMFPRDSGDGSNSRISMTSASKRPVAGKLAFISVASKFRAQLNQLMEKLDKSGANFIRCVKPNVSMVARQFEGGIVLSQLEYSGMTTVLELMQQGFPSRVRFADLYKIYSAILPADLARLDPKLFCKLLFKAVGLNEADFQFGMSKVFFRPGKMAIFDQLIRSDPDNVKALVAKVKGWLIKYRWRKAQYGVWEVIKLKKKIAWRRAQIIKIQKTMRMWLARKRLGPKIAGLVRLRSLGNTFDKMAAICDQLKSNKTKGADLIAGNKQKLKVVETQIRQMPSKDLKKIGGLVDGFRTELDKDMTALRKLIESEKKSAEKEHLRKIQEELELEKKKAEELKQKQINEDEEKKAKVERETKRVLEEQRLKKLGATTAKQSSMQKQQADMESFMEETARDQERRDRELALRVSRGDESAVEATATVNFGNKGKIAGGAKVNVTEMQYDELRRIINQSTDVQLIEACQAEFHRRINAYNQWKAKKGKSSKLGEKPSTKSEDLFDGGIQEVVSPKSPTPSTSSATRSGSAKPPKSPSGHPPQRYFRLPFKANHKKPAPGIWLGHFDGEYIARQIELHDKNVKILLLAGVDDIAMCDLSLSSTGLGIKKGTEISETEFEDIWCDLGGRDLIRHRSANISSKYLRDKFLSKK